ncbi:hypothetical protein KBD61_02005 [Patescibacteria group bacterium]|nr:hypothetical protein [Patescibacteria group bacterium]MBP9709784.1 hypothetical protein [Patescibacteria group bacterium]
MFNDSSAYPVHQYISPTPTDLITIFPEARTGYILPRLRELESYVTKLESAIAISIRRSQCIKDGWFVREVLKVFDVSDLVDFRRETFRLKRYLPIKIKPSRSGVNQEQIARAKEYPILQIAEFHLQNIKKCGGTYRTLCPYHDERTPSFYLYPQTNTFHCYGCQEHGDVISLTKKLHNLGFVETIKYLAPTYE